MSPSVSSAEPPSPPLFFKIHGPPGACFAQASGAMNILMEHFSGGFRAFPPNFFNVFSNTF